ncbi:glutaminase A [Agromyces aerolatus]|uniref:glutaminase A n=1 Tax=Agromyces sp. LY-1074 TaxID=3074080 RepID=UPI00286082D9|nr:MULTISPECIES: glutaminase A [unclassified Agromyces]MDR5698553.1 glutaminase A [Agromyces sp. LY-1074]MDR5704847.1 glutaminase A [Agromyces sp. LY-1358]
MPVDMTHPVRTTLEAILDAARPDTSGHVADYIPELANVDPEPLGISLVSTRGAIHDAGDSDIPFTIQSVSKPFVFALALDALGVDEVTKHVGLEPSGEPFNAISLDAASGRPLNPMINAGAIVTSSLIEGATADAKFSAIKAGLERFAGRDLVVNDDVYSSEQDTGDRNRALAYLALATGALAAPVDVATTAYFRQCSLDVTARDLAIMASTLATGGVNPITGERVVSEHAARWTTAVMTSCGMYNESGTWMVHVGLPAKSGVGGGIVAVQPGQFGIGTFSPRLDERGNSVRGVAMLEALSKQYGLHMLAHRGTPLSPIASLTPEAGHTIAALRGEIYFASAEEIFTRLTPLLNDDGCLVLDFSNVTRVGLAVKELFRAVPAIVGVTSSGQPRAIVVDPDGVLDDA